MIKEITSEQFYQFSKTFSDKSPYQTDSYGTTMSFEKYNIIYLGFEVNFKIVAATLLLIKNVDGFKYAYAPRGFLIDYNDYKLLEEFTREIKQYLSKKGIVAIKLSPMIVKNIYDDNNNIIYSNKNYDDLFNVLKKLGYYHLGYNNYFEALKPRFEAVVDLDKPYFEAFKSLSKNYRTKIRSAEKNGIRIYKAGKDMLEELSKQLNKNYPRSKEYFKNLYDNFDKYNEIELYYAKLDSSLYLKVMQNKYIKQEDLSGILNSQVINNKGQNKNALINKKINVDRELNKCHDKLTEAIELNNKYPNGIILATILLVKISGKLYVMMDTYNKEFKYMNAKHLLIWKIIEKYCKEGYNFLNLGGVSNSQNTTDKFYGLKDFKLNFGASIYEYIGDLELITNKTLYIMYKNSASFKSIFKG